MNDKANNKTNDNLQCIFALMFEKGGDYLRIDETSLIPLFMQVAQWIESEILKDNIREEEQIPSTNQFATIYNINPATARKGFDILTEEGIIYKKRGIGMFVAEGAKELIRRKAKDRFVNESLRGLLDEADRLGITTDEIIAMIKDKEGTR